MKYALRTAVSTVLFLLVPCVGLLCGATVKKKDGQVVKGEIKDLVVQKGNVEVTNNDNGTKSYRVGYVLTNGERISAIDEKGVHASWIMQIGATEEGQPPTDLEVLKPGEKTGIANPRKGGKLLVLSFDFAPGVPINEPLVGALRRKPGTDKEEYIIVPELAVATKDGTVTVPVSDIPRFEKRVSKK
jgi:hypothetical protein